jgi:hypothetical protein
MRQLQQPPFSHTFLVLEDNESRTDSLRVRGFVDLLFKENR